MARRDHVFGIVSTIDGGMRRIEVDGRVGISALLSLAGSKMTLEPRSKRTALIGNTALESFRLRTKRVATATSCHRLQPLYAV